MHVFTKPTLGTFVTAPQTAMSCIYPSVDVAATDFYTSHEAMVIPSQGAEHGFHHPLFMYETVPYTVGMDLGKRPLTDREARLALASFYLNRALSMSTGDAYKDIDKNLFAANIMADARMYDRVNTMDLEGPRANAWKDIFVAKAKAREGLIDEARAIFQALLQSDVGIWWNGKERFEHVIGEAMADVGMYEDAQEIGSTSDYLRYHTNQAIIRAKARADLRTGDYQKALARVPEITDDNLSKEIVRAVALQGDAEKVLGLEMRHPSQRVDLWLAVAEVWSAQGKYDEALNLANREGFDQGRIGSGDSLKYFVAKDKARAGKYDEALATDVGLWDQDLILFVSKQMLKNGHTQQAKDLFVDIVRKDAGRFPPLPYEFRHALCELMWDIGLHNEASFLAVDDNYRPSVSSKVKKLIEQERLDEAMDMLPRDVSRWEGAALRLRVAKAMLSKAAKLFEQSQQAV